MERPFEAYRGDEPYVFVCYAHDDKAVVYPEITWLHDQGANVWYDEGISPGEEWSEELGQAIEGAERFLYFVSPQSVASKHCRNELNFAQNHDKPILSVYLEETELPSGVELVISASQAIVKSDLSDANYRARLIRTLGRPNPSLDVPSVTRDSTKATPHRPAPWQLATALFLVVCAGVAVWFLSQPAPEVADAASHALDRSLAVLPLSRLGTDDRVATYAGALTEELRAAVTGYQELRIVAVPDATDTLEVQAASYVLGGNLQNIDGRIRLRAQLTRTDDRQTIWARVFERSATDGLPDPAEMAATVGRFVRLQLVVDHQCESVRRSSPSEEAATAYCASLTETYRGTQVGDADGQLQLNQARRAVTLDPHIVDAHFLVGIGYFSLGWTGEMSWREAAQQARAALERGQALAPDDAQLLALRGRIEQLELDYPASEASLQASLSRDPLHPRASLNYWRLGITVLAQGRLDDALAHFRLAVRLNDANALLYAYYAAVLFFAGENRESIRAADAGVRLVESGLAQVYLLAFKTLAHQALSEISAANATLDEALASVSPVWKPFLAAPLVSLGRAAEARVLLAELEAVESPLEAAMVDGYAALGDERAFDWIHKAIDRHVIAVTGVLRTHPYYSELRKDRRWEEVMAHLEAEETEGRGRANEHR